MTQLIITLIAIALSSVMMITGYVMETTKKPGKIASEAYTYINSAKVLENAFRVRYDLGNGQKDPATQTADGGVEEYTKNLIDFIPEAPPGYSWSYGVQGNSSGIYSNLPYLCLKRNQPSPPRDSMKHVAEYMKLNAGKDQVQYGSQCGVTSSNAPPVAITYYFDPSK